MSPDYAMIDRFLRNNLNSDEDYAEYSEALDRVLFAAPPAPSAEPTDEMVQAACEAHLREWAARVLDGYVYSAADIDDDARACMRAALRAAMGAQ